MTFNLLQENEMQTCAKNATYFLVITLLYLSTVKSIGYECLLLLSLIVNAGILSI